MDVDEGDEEDGGRDFRPTDHVGGKLRKACGFRFETPSLTPTTRTGWGPNGEVDCVGCLANDVS